MGCAHPARVQKVGRARCLLCCCCPWGRRINTGCALSPRFLGPESKHKNISVCHGKVSVPFANQTESRPGAADAGAVLAATSRQDWSPGRERSYALHPPGAECKRAPVAPDLIRRFFFFYLACRFSRVLLPVEMRCLGKRRSSPRAAVVNQNDLRAERSLDKHRAAYLGARAR